MRSPSSNLMRQIGMALLGHALPEPRVLAVTMSHFRKGVFATIMSGVLACAVILMASLAFYQYLLAEGLAEHAALLLTAGALTLIAVIMGLLARGHMYHVAATREYFGIFPKKTTQSTGIEEVVAAFLDGLCVDEPQMPTRQEFVATTRNGEDPVKHHEKDDARERIILVKQ